jgi:Domain of unknown function (DUF4082)
LPAQRFNKARHGFSAARRERLGQHRGSRFARQSRRTRLLMTALSGGVVAALAVVGVTLVDHAASAANASPVSIYPTGTKPAQTEAYDRKSIELGVRFSTSVNGTIVALKFYKASINTGVHTGTLWTNTGAKLASGTFSKESASGWQTLTLAKPVAVTAGTNYVASYHAPIGRYSETQQQFLRGRTVGNSLIKATGGVYTYSAAAKFPTTSWNSSAYGVDVSFLAGKGAVTASGPTSTPPTPTAPISTSSTPTKTTTPSPTPTKSTTASSPVSAPSSTKPATSTAPSTTHSSVPPTSPSTSTSSSASAPPVLTGFPDASDTGVPTGTKLIAVPGTVKSGPGWVWDSRGWVAVNGAGTVFSGYAVTGSIEVYAVGAVIKDNDIAASGEGWAIGLRPSASNVTVSDNTIHGPCVQCSNRLTYGIFGDLGGDAGSQILRNNLYDIDHPLQQERGLVQDNYVHGLAANGTTDHVDAFFSGGGTPDQLTIRHNTLINDWKGEGSTSAILLSNAFGTQSNRLVEDNLLGGGGYTLYGGNATSGSNVIIRNNVFTTTLYPKSGFYGPTTAIQNGGSNSFTNNVWADGANAGKTISPSS